MKIPGIIGGVGPESTVDYYRSIISLYRERYDPHGYPELLIASIDMTRMLSMIEANDMGSLVDLLVGTFSRLRSAGADFGAIASNTPHVVFDELRKAVPMPLISIVESTTERAASAGITRAALLGTAFTMNNDFYQTSFERRGISLLVPSPDEREYIHLRIFDELEFGLVKPDTRKGFDAIIGRMREEHGIEGVVLIALNCRCPGTGRTETTIIRPGFTSRRSSPLWDKHTRGKARIHAHQSGPLSNHRNICTAAYNYTSETPPWKRRKSPRLRELLQLFSAFIASPVISVSASIPLKVACAGVGMACAQTRARGDGSIHGAGSPAWQYL